MNIDNIVYLKSVLGEEETKKYLNADEERIKMLVEVLRSTSLKRLLGSNFNDFCNKLVYGKYGKVYARVLCNFGRLDKSLGFPYFYQIFLSDYMLSGYNNEKNYKKLFKHVKVLNAIFSMPINYDSVKELVDKEVDEVKNVIAIDEFLENGGSLEELITAINNCGIKDFTKDTKLPVSKLKTMKQQKYEVSISQISYLVSLMSSLDLDKKTQIELLKVYYKVIEQNKQQSCLSDILVVENKPNLYKFLKGRGLIANILENELADECVKQFEKVN